MASQTSSYQCPSCTGPLQFDGKTGKLICEYCGSVYDVKEIEALFADKNKKAAEAAEGRPGDAAGEVSAAELEHAWGADAAKMRAYSCTSCGAELICEQSTAATICPYCSNPTIIPSQFEGILRPDYVVPFRKSREEAVNALKSYYGGRILLPGSFGKTNHIEEIQGVYVPFWMFSGSVDASAVYEGVQEEKRTQGDVEITTSRFYEVRRKGRLDFDKIPADASTRMPDDLMDSIEPYDYKELQPFAMSYLPGFVADKYDVDEMACRERAEKRARNTAQEALRNTVKGYSKVNARSHEEKVTFSRTRYALMPVWLLSTKWNGRTFLFAMNGQTGRMTGDLPVSNPKAWGIFAVLTAVLYFLLHMVMKDSAVLPLIISLVIAGIVQLVLRSSMKPVARKQKAGSYVVGGSQSGLRLSLSTDSYVRTAENRRKIEKKK